MSLRQPEVGPRAVVGVHTWRIECCHADWLRNVPPPPTKPVRRLQRRLYSARSVRRKRPESCRPVRVVASLHPIVTRRQWRDRRWQIRATRAVRHQPGRCGWEYRWSALTHDHVIYHRQPIWAWAADTRGASCRDFPAGATKAVAGHPYAGSSERGLLAEAALKENRHGNVPSGASA